MGNKEGKFKKIFEEIDTSGDCKVSLDELINFLGEKIVFLFSFKALRLWVLSQADKTITSIISLVQVKVFFFQKV